MFTKRQEAELITSILGRGEIPLKFNYLGKGSSKWVAIAKKRSKGGINSIETSLLTAKANQVLASLDNEKINVIDIGCGDGTPCYPILNELKKTHKNFRYVALDISHEMTKIAVKNISEKYKCEYKEVVLDFELGNFADITYELKENGSSNLLCFLGSTIGNFSDRNRVLTNIRDSMGSDDFLLLGVEMTNFSKINKIIPHYLASEVKDLVYTVGNYIGINDKNSKYSVIWNEQKSQVEMWANLTKNCKLKINKSQFLLEKDEKILLARSVKFNEWIFTKIFSDIGFRTEFLTTTKDRGYIISMVQPTRYQV